MRKKEFMIGPVLILTAILTGLSADRVVQRTAR